jgi:hypothetical protein
MAEPEPSEDLSAFSSPGATATAWEGGRRELEEAELFWLSTVRPDGRPHTTPLLAVWLDGALCFCTGGDERKAKNIGANPHCTLTTGGDGLEGLDVVVEGQAIQLHDPSRRRAIADRYESKYGPHFASPNGTWAGLGDAIRSGDVLVYRLSPVTAFGFGRGDHYSQTRWRFS